MFWWLYYSDILSADEVPIVMWFQGGPVSHHRYNFEIVLLVARRGTERTYAPARERLGLVSGTLKK